MSSSPVYLPSDPLFPLQWHLLNTGNTPGSIAGFDINVVSIWPDYTGRGVLIGVLDDGMDNTHPDLVPNYRQDLSWDVSLDEPDGRVKTRHDEHGVAVAGLVAAAADNGIGGTGVAWGSEFTMYRMDLFDTSLPQILADYQRAAQKKVADGIAVSSNSWGPGMLMSQEWLSAYHAAGRHMSEAGRDGLGIVSLFAAGNDREEHMNTNYDPTDNSPWAIIVAASHQNGGITEYSTEGASILITAPGSNPGSIVTTDRQGVDGYNTNPGVAGDYTHDFNGTSAATPIAAGIVALMLEANSGLGYRDVQEILVYSAQRATFLEREVDKAFNGAVDWNGGALLASHDFGYGHIDAHAAVRLAESWMKLGTVANLVLDPGEIMQPTVAVGPGAQGQVTARFASDYRVEQVTVTLRLTSADLEGLSLELVSPDGMISRLMEISKDDDADDDDDDGWEWDDDDDDDDYEDDGSLHHTFNTVLNWGSGLAGDWTLNIGNTSEDDVFQLEEWSILAFTAGAPAGGTQIFTDEFADFVSLQPGRAVLEAAKGTTLNAAAVTGDVRFDLGDGASHIGETDIAIAWNQHVLHLVSGDGDDILIGNDNANILMAGRGNNHLDGAAGLDVARLIGARAGYEIEHEEGLLSVRSTALSGGGVDHLQNIELLHFSDQVVLAHTPTNIGPDLFDEASYLAQNPDVAAAILEEGWLASGLHHYNVWGAAEGRNPNALFSEQWYLAQNADVAAAVSTAQLASGFQHYQEWGWSEGRDPSAWMDTSTYLMENPDVAAAQMNPLQHYLLYGVHEGRTITALQTDMWA